MNDTVYIESLCRKAREASLIAARLSTVDKNLILNAIADQVQVRKSYIIAENRKDLEAAGAEGVTRAFLDRLMLNEDRLAAIAQSIREIADLEDPVGKVHDMSIRPSGIRVGQMSVPIGVVSVIFESRPNVTTDIAALCLKSGNACILRGGRESINSNIALHRIITEALESRGVPVNAVTLVDRVEHSLVSLLLKMNKYIDIVIPRGGDRLIKMVTDESTIPVIKHDKGVCHTYIDESADLAMATAITINAKVQRPGVCNAMETLLIHSAFPWKKELLESISAKGVELRGCESTMNIIPGIRKASEDDWHAEYLDLILSVRLVDSIDNAMHHIAEYGSGHSEAIVTANYANAERFLREVDSSAVFVNASTRFHDGGEFGLGAEVGISTQKLHARGTMGIEGLTCKKYIIYGNGQVRS